MLEVGTVYEFVFGDNTKSDSVYTYQGATLKNGSISLVFTDEDGSKHFVFQSNCSGTFSQDKDGIREAVAIAPVVV